MVGEDGGPRLLERSAPPSSASERQLGRGDGSTPVVVTFLCSPLSIAINGETIAAGGGIPPAIN
jgi:hypothetical protein